MVHSVGNEVGTVALRRRTQSGLGNGEGITVDALEIAVHTHTLVRRGTVCDSPPTDRQTHTQRDSDRERHTTKNARARVCVQAHAHTRMCARVHRCVKARRLCDSAQTEANLQSTHASKLVLRDRAAPVNIELSERGLQLVVLCLGVCSGERKTGSLMHTASRDSRLISQHRHSTAPYLLGTWRARWQKGARGGTGVACGCWRAPFPAPCLFFSINATNSSKQMLPLASLSASANMAWHGPAHGEADISRSAGAHPRASGAEPARAQWRAYDRVCARSVAWAAPALSSHGTTIPRCLCPTGCGPSLAWPRRIRCFPCPPRWTTQTPKQGMHSTAHTARTVGEARARHTPHDHLAPRRVLCLNTHRQSRSQQRPRY